VTLNNHKSIEFTDKENLDLTGKHLVIGTVGSRANFRDIVVLPE